MKYQFKYQTTALDFWKLSMYYLYGSMVGVCNIIFTVAMLVLTVTFWGEVSGLIRVLLVLACCVFPVIQPAGIYVRAKKQIATMPRDMQIGFDERGIHVKTPDQSSDLVWHSIKRVSKKPSMLVIFSTTTYGFVLTNKVLGNQKEALYGYVISKMKNK